MDLDAAGGAVSGGLVAGALEKPEGKAGAAHDGTCSDCGHAVSGNFCANCGQPTHVHRTLLHLGEELLHGVMHFDGRVWRTVPLLVTNPGRLTREWVAGKRARYVSPLGLFLFTIFLMFFVLSFGAGGKALDGGKLSTSLAAAEDVVAETRQQVAEARAELDAAEAASKGDPAAQAGLTQARQRLEITSDGLKQAQAKLDELKSTKASTRPDGLEPGSWQAQLRDATTSGKIKSTTGGGFSQTVLKKLANPDLALYKLQQTTYKFSFLLVPLSIPFVALLFLWKRGFTLYDHGVFVLYSLTFMAMLSMALGLLGGVSWLSGLVALAAVFAPPAHMFAQLKGAYGLSVFSALWRTVLLLLFCVIVLSLFLIAIIYLGLGH